MKKGYGFLLIAIVLVLLGYFLRDIDFQEVYTLFWEGNVLFFSIAFLCTSASFLVWNLRWKSTLSGFVNPNYWFLLQVLLAGVFLNIITPGTGIGGEPIRAYFLSKTFKRSKTKFVGNILADKIFNQVVFLSLVMFSILFVILFIDIPPALKLTLQLTLFIIIIAILLVVFSIWKNMIVNPNRMLSKLYMFKFIKTRFKDEKDFKRFLNLKIRNFFRIFNRTVRNKRKLRNGVFYSAIMWAFVFLTSYFLFISFGTRVSFLSIVIVVTLGLLIGEISPIPGGFGLVEGSMFLLYAAMGIAAPLAAIVVLFSRMIYYFHAIVLGGTSLIYLKLTIK
jgi:uncharacterized protein (TIRG00374 family)